MAWMTHVCLMLAHRQTTNEFNPSHVVLPSGSFTAPGRFKWRRSVPKPRSYCISTLGVLATTHQLPPLRALQGTQNDKIDFVFVTGESEVEHMHQIMSMHMYMQTCWSYMPADGWNSMDAQQTRLIGIRHAISTTRTMWPALQHVNRPCTGVRCRQMHGAACNNCETYMQAG